MDDIAALTAMHIHCAVGMAIYTGRLALSDLRKLNYLISVTSTPISSSTVKTQKISMVKNK